MVWSRVARGQRVAIVALAVAVAAVGTLGAVLIVVLGVSAWVLYAVGLAMSSADGLYWLRRRNMRQVAGSVILVAIWGFLTWASLGGL